MKRLWLVFLLIITGLSACTPQSQDNPTQGVTTIQNKGSDTMVNLALAWAETYQKTHPEVSISVTGGGTGTGLAALLNNTVDIANASRKIKNEEISTAVAGGVTPQEFIVARDAIAVIVHPDNPINELTLEQIAAIYSGKINNWSEIGGEDRPIVRLSRETNSGTHVYFLETVIRLGSKEDKTIFSADTLLLPSSEGIISEVSSNPNAIGYDGLGYITTHVKMLAVAGKDSNNYVIPSVETVNSGAYPISRDLYIYTNGLPAGALKDYVDWMFTAEAQAIVMNLGFVPISTGTTAP